MVPKQDKFKTLATSPYVWGALITVIGQLITAWASGHLDPSLVIGSLGVISGAAGAALDAGKAP